MILDIGCSGGGQRELMIKQLAPQRLSAIDVFEEAVRFCQRRFAGSAEIVGADVKELPFAADSFDLITAFESVYFWQDYHQAFELTHNLKVMGLRGLLFQEIRRVLRPGGELLILVELTDPASA